MLLFSWNVRGLNSPLKQHELVRLMQKHKFDVCGLLETKLVSSKLQFMHRFRLKCWKLVSNVEAAGTARVIVLWNPSTVHVDVLDSSSQFIHVSIRCLSSHLTFAASFVYGYNTISGRRTLWDGLKSWASTGPWLVLGDFNSTLSQDDKYNGEPVSSYEVSDFRACCSELELSDLNYTGCHYTWSNGTVWTKIDRVLANPSWNNIQLTSHVHVHPAGAFSDHSGAHVRIGGSSPPGRRSFKFFNMWIEHSEYAGLISDGWQIPVEGSPMFILCRKLKSLKQPLKSLNKLHFSHILERVTRMEADLEHHQHLLHDSRDDISLLNRVNALKINLINLKSAEQAFFSQKLKCTFLKDSDRGTRFFHALMSHRHRKSFIPALQCSTGDLTTNIDEVGAEFVQFYQSLLGTSSAISPIDEDVVHSGPCLDTTHSDFLLAPVTNETIKEALFSVGNNKAPGPDGFSLFFSNSLGILWELISVQRSRISFPLVGSSSR